MTIKKKIETKYRLPNLNWIALKPQQVKGTVFCELDDEKLLKVIDFETFEELFKTGSGQVPLEPLNALVNTMRPKKPENQTLLEPQRQRNLGNTFGHVFKGILLNKLTNQQLLYVKFVYFSTLIQRCSFICNLTSYDDK